MKNKHMLALVTAFLFAGCGGGGEDTPSDGSSTTTTTTKGTYQIWDYLVPVSNTTSNYLKTNGTDTQEYQSKFIKADNTVTESSDYAKNEQTIYTKNSDSITIAFYKNGAKNGAYNLKTSADIGDIVTIKQSNCVLKKHHDNIKIDTKDFNDVIEIVCGIQPGYYQKGVGEIAQEQIKTVSGTTEISVLSR